MTACFDQEVAMCLNCAAKQPSLELGQISKHRCANCDMAIVVHRSEVLHGNYLVACQNHSLRKMKNGNLLCTDCGFETESSVDYFFRHGKVQA